MQSIGIKRFILLPAAVLLCLAGCDKGVTTIQNDVNSNGNKSLSAVYSSYEPAGVDILPMTEFCVIAQSDEQQAVTGIRACVHLRDSFGSDVKKPGTFRFELFTRVLRSADSKGKRVKFWPDVELVSAEENNSYWRDFLRAYEFDLKFEPGDNQEYVLQVTFISASGKRLSDEFVVKNR